MTAATLAVRQQTERRATTDGQRYMTRDCDKVHEQPKRSKKGGFL